MMGAALFAVLRAGCKGLSAACLSLPGRTGLCLFGALILLVIGYRAGNVRGQATCQRAQADAAVMVARKARGAMAVTAAAETRRLTGANMENRNREVVRYVTQQAAAQDDGGSICIAAGLADRLRGLQ